MNVLLYLMIGGIAGIFSGMFGLGGGIIVVPLLVLFFKFPMQIASATSLVIFLLPVGALGVWKYYSAGIIQNEHIKIGITIAIALMFGSFIGAKIASNMNSIMLQKIFSVVLLIVAVKMWMSAK